MPEPPPQHQIAFLTDLQRLLSEGSFVATYKYALLLALANLCVERGQDDDTALTIPTYLIAEKFAHYYWRQAAPYIRSGSAETGPVLRQNTGRQAGIVRVIQELRDLHEGSLLEANRDEKKWKRVVTRVDQFVRIMPLWKLQTVGRERLEFLYTNAGRGNRITLKPGVAYCFRKHYGLVVDLVKGAWARYVRRFNPEVLGAGADLHEFLFGSERSSLLEIKPILEEFQEGKCFYCRRRVKDEAAHVDHFIPWSRYSLDLGHNFVLAHATCNGNKSDRLACATHLDNWVSHCEHHASDLGREFDRVSVPVDLPTSARIATWAYRQTHQARGLTWVRGNELEPLPADWGRGLGEFVNC